MFEGKLKTVKSDIGTVRAVIEINDRLRTILFAGDTVRQKIEENSELAALTKVLPDDISWQIYDHCAAITRLYAIYENFVEEIISSWLQLLPNLVLSYSDLSEKIQNTHREGTGRLLVELKKNRFQHLSTTKVVKSLSSGVSGAKPYELLPDAFLFYEQNLRRNELERLLSNVGIENSWNWINKHRVIKYFVEEIRGSQNTAEGELNQLVNYRNDAAHGSVDELLGTQELLDLTDFVKALCEALVELINYQILDKKVQIKQAKKVGKIMEWFKEPDAGVALVKKTIVSLGKPVWLVNKKSSCCKLAIIKSIRLDEKPKSEIEVITETEVGLKFDIEAKRGLSIYEVK